VILSGQASSLIYLGSGGEGSTFFGGGGALPEINGDSDKDLTATPHSISVLVVVLRLIER
jgi:hypothetical protein